MKKFLQRLNKNIVRETKRILNKFERAWYLTKIISPKKGSARWLVQSEIKYGGFVTGVKRNKISSSDPRKKEEILKGGMTGGDRMYNHLYAGRYAKYLNLVTRKGNPVTLIEVGILKGSGIAMWCDLFPSSRIIGLDIDLSHVYNNMNFLKSRGAFKQNEPELYEFDQYEDNQQLLEDFLNGVTIDVFIDDGFHSMETILTTILSVLPHLAKEFVYFIEDNEEVHIQLKKLYPNFLIEYSNRLTIITPK